LKDILLKMEIPTITRRRTLQCLALAMGAAIIPGHVEASAFDEKKPIHVKSGQGKNGKIGEGDIIFKFDKSQTDGHLGITESMLPVGVLGAPPHLHHGFDEICRVTQGTLTILVGDEVFKVSQGDWHLRPRGIVHSFWNTGSEPAKFIEIYSPGGHEAYMNELSDQFLGNRRPAPGALNLMAEKYDISFDWPRLKVIMDTYRVRL
jgi:mannose-6-phosphate isomerase-like protein (cupin superfamily)